MLTFDYAAPAEFFSGAKAGRRKSVFKYLRFDSGAEAVRYVIEEVPQADLAGIILESGEERFDHFAIRTLYESADYPLSRHDRSN